MRFDRSQRPQEPDQQLVAPQERKVFLAGRVVRPVTQDLEDDLGRCEDVVAGRYDLGPRACIPRPEIRPCSGPGFHDDFEAGLRQEAGTTAGTIATRRSPGKISRGIPMIMEKGSDRCVPGPDRSNANRPPGARGKRERVG